MSFLRPATQLARTQARSTTIAARAFARSNSSFKADTTPSTQGHVTRKSKDPIHTDKDIQSSYARSGDKNKKEARAGNGDGEDQPFDAARLGNKGGELKTNSAAGTGAFKDQVGGQGAGGAQKGEKVDAAGESYTDMAKNVLTGNFGKGAKVGNMEHMAETQREFHSSARSFVEPSSDAGPKSREPKNEVESQGDQSAHLKHKKDASKPDLGKGNAAPEPHLPSKQQTRGYATRPPGGYSKTFNSEAEEKGYDTPAEALPSTLKSAYAPEATAEPDANLTPSHESGMASTSMAPPHPVLTEQAKQGTLADRNPPPGPEAGEQGLKEAWKHRKV